jgi:D-alanyl-D-alanine carboxypeptidase (penicillin-binding protein 5/6)
VLRHHCGDEPRKAASTAKTTTALDLVKLAVVAMGNPFFREIVATPRREGRVVGGDGTVRELAWENTNRLLGLGLGYEGVKTGVTDQAGHCLVASGRRGEDRLLLVVLGCDSGEARFADARNHFRWAWGRRAGERP